MLPAAQSATGFCGSIEVLYTAVVAIIFLSGGVSSELYVLFFPPLFAAARTGPGWWSSLPSSPSCSPRPGYDAEPSGRGERGRDRLVGLQTARRPWSESRSSRRALATASSLGPRDTRVVIYPRLTPRRPPRGGFVGRDRSDAGGRLRGRLPERDNPGRQESADRSPPLPGRPLKPPWGPFVPMV